MHRVIYGESHPPITSLRADLKPVLGKAKSRCQAYELIKAYRERFQKDRTLYSADDIARRFRLSGPQENVEHLIFVGAKTDTAHPHETLFEETIHILQGGEDFQLHFLNYVANEYINCFIRFLFMSIKSNHPCRNDCA
jgi:hypothetical protein